MTNLLREQRIVDNAKRALIKYVFVYVDTAEANTLLVDVSTLSGALNTSGFIMTSNTDIRSLYKTMIKRIFGILFEITAQLHRFPGQTVSVSVKTKMFDQHQQEFSMRARFVDHEIKRVSFMSPIALYILYFEFFGLCC